MESVHTSVPVKWVTPVAEQNVLPEPVVASQDLPVRFALIVALFQERGVVLSGACEGEERRDHVHVVSPVKSQHQSITGREAKRTTYHSCTYFSLCEMAPFEALGTDSRICFSCLAAASANVWFDLSVNVKSVSITAIPRPSIWHNEHEF